MTDLGGKTCLIVGAGGAARAIGFILREKGLPLAVTNRSTPRGEGLADALGCPFFPLNEIRNFQADIVIQTTPVGMVPQDNACLLSPDALREGMVVMDMVYNPPETVLLKRARSKSCVTVPGLGMFIHQGAEQFRLWTGLEPPVDIMRRAVGDALRRGR
jgi:shikimate dehydrogenase